MRPLRVEAGTGNAWLGLTDKAEKRFADRAAYSTVQKSEEGNGTCYTFLCALFLPCVLVLPCFFVERHEVRLLFQQVIAVE